MNLFTRISATLTRKLDDAVAQIENHDAVVSVSLKDMRAAIAKARTRLNQLQRESQKFADKITYCENQAALWQARAKEVAAQDEEKALECVARRNHLQEKGKQLNTLMVKNKQVEAQIFDTVKQLESKLHAVTQQHQAMRSRQSTAEAMRILNAVTAESPTNLDTTFDRWEMQLTEAEYNGHLSMDETDLLEREFLDAENKASLKAELNSLIRSDSNNTQ